ncbi:MAG: tetratricopeptide repeat protein [Planctomycetota bacterium]
MDLDLIQDLALLHLQAELTLDAPLPLLKGELLGVERVAIAGGTVLGERVRETTLLTGAVSVPPLMRVAQAQGMTAKGLAGSPVLNHRGQIIGLLTSRIYEASGTRLVASGAAIGMLQVGAPLQLGQAGIPRSTEFLGSLEGQAWTQEQEGIAALLVGHGEEALAKLEPLKSQSALLWCALTLGSQKREVEALEIVEVLAGLRADWYWPPLAMAQFQEQILMPKEALASLQSARRIDARSPLVALALAAGLDRQSRGQESLTLLKGVDSSCPSLLPAMLLRGRVLANRLRLEEAREEFNAVLALDPPNPDALVGQGNIDLVLRNSRQAGNYFQTALKSAPEHYGALVGAAEVHLARREWEPALAALAPLLQKYPGRTHLWILSGQANLRLRKLERSIENFEHATFLDPDSEEAYMGLGQAFKESLEFERAIQAFDQVLRVNPKSTGALFTAGVCHLMLGSRGDARARYKQLLPLDPASADRLFRMIYNK